MIRLSPAYHRLLIRPVSAMRSDIQALRAVAVLAVVIYHLWPIALPGGFMGVDVFFVVSGYLMTASIWKSLHQPGQTDAGISSRSPWGRGRLAVGFLTAFYARRIRRLAPAATACLLGVLFIIYLIGDFSLQSSTTSQILASSLFIQNWFLAHQAADYLGSDSGATAVQHFWSLSLEEQFYIGWPILLLILGWFMILLRRKPRLIQTWLPYLGFIVIAALTIASFGLGVWLSYRQPALAYFVTPTRLWELSLGGALVFLPLAVSPRWRLCLPWIGLLMMSHAFMAWAGQPFPGWYALLPTLGTALVLVGGQPPLGSQSTMNGYSLANLARFSPVQFVGDISYSLYLWHWPLIILVPFALNLSLSNHLPLGLALLGASLAMAVASYYGIEQPAKKLFSNTFTAVWLPKYRGTNMTLAAGLACLLVVTIPAYLQQDGVQYKADQALNRAFARATDPNDIDYGAKATLHTDRLDYNPYGRLDRQWAQYARLHFSGTMANPKNDYSVGMDINAQMALDEVGYFGDLGSPKTMLVLGDSYSQQWYPAIDLAAQKLGYRAIAANSITAGGGMFELESNSGQETFTVSQGFVSSVKRANSRFTYIKDNLWSEADVVLVGVFPGYFTLSGDSPETAPDAHAKLAQTFKDIWQVTGHKPILIQGVPSLTSEPDPWLAIGRTDRTLAHFDEYIDRVYLRLKQIEAESTFDYLPTRSLVVDDEGLAHTQVGGLPVYYDTVHINSLFAASAGDYFAVQLAKIIDQRGY